MKNIRKIDVLLIFIFFILASCKQKKNKEDYEGELKIDADTNLAYLLEQFVPVFQNIYPAIQLKISYKYEEELLKDYFNNRTDNIIISRRLTANEIAYADQEKKANTSQFTFGYDAIAAFTNIASADSVWDMEHYSTQQLVFDNIKSGIIKQIFPDSVKKITALLADENNSVPYLVKSKNAIGFVLFNQISNKHTTKEFYTQFKLLKIKKQNKTYELNQEQLFQDNYPFVRELTIVSTQSMNTKQRLFSRFLFKPRASKIITHHGIVPAKIPAVEITIIDKNFAVK